MKLPFAFKAGIDDQAVSVEGVSARVLSLAVDVDRGSAQAAWRFTLPLAVVDHRAGRAKIHPVPNLDLLLPFATLMTSLAVRRLMRRHNGRRE